MKSVVAMEEDVVDVEVNSDDESMRSLRIDLGEGGGVMAVADQVGTVKDEVGEGGKSLQQDQLLHVSTQHRDSYRIKYSIDIIAYY